MVVDLPGYGYAKVSKALRAQWAPLIEQYLDGSEQLRAVVVLVESRVLSEQDQSDDRMALVRRTASRRGGDESGQVKNERAN